MRHSQVWHNRLRLAMPPLGSDTFNRIKNRLDRNNDESTLEDLARLRRLEAAEAYHRNHAEQDVRDGYLLSPISPAQSGLNLT